MSWAGKSLAEILGIPAGVNFELMGIESDTAADVVRVEYLGQEGVQIVTYTADEARRVAAEMFEWANRKEAGEIAPGE